MFKSKQIILFLCLINWNLQSASDNKETQMAVQSTNKYYLLDQVTNIFDIQNIIAQYLACDWDFERKMELHDRTLIIRLFPNQDFIVLMDAHRKFFIRNLKENISYEMPGECHAMAFSNTHLALVNNNLNKKMRFLNLQKLRLDKSFDKFIDITQYLCSLVYSRDFKYLACGTNIGIVYIFDLDNKALLTKFKANEDNESKSVDALDFCPNGKYLASFGSDRSIKIWDYRNKRSIYEFSVNQRHINKLFFSENNELLGYLSYINNGRMYIIDLIKFNTTHSTSPFELDDFLFMNSQLMILSKNNKLINCCAVKKSENNTVFNMDDMKSTSRSFSQDGKFLAIADYRSGYLYLLKNRYAKLLEAVSQNR